MTPSILGLDIGGANLKAATPDKRAVSVPFALWKQPDKLPAALAALVAQFPDAEELAVTMTGELCDCFETKREGVNAIVDAVAACGSARFWSTNGAFVSAEEAKRDHMKVAAANWHALATFAGRYVPEGRGLLIDMGSTTTDVIPLQDGQPCPKGTTDQERLQTKELDYFGVRRTPLCAVNNWRVCAELFATTQDVFVVLGDIGEEPDNCDTADSRPFTVGYSLARLARMLGGDVETLSETEIRNYADRLRRWARMKLKLHIGETHFAAGEVPRPRKVIVSGTGEFFIRSVLDSIAEGTAREAISLNDELGPSVSACAPAYAVAVLAAEQRP